MALKSLVSLDPEAARSAARLLEDLLEAKPPVVLSPGDADENWRAFVEMLPHAVFRKDLEGRFVFVNQALCTSLNRPRAEILGKTDADLLPGDMADRIRQDDLLALDAGGHAQADYDWPGRPTVMLRVLRAPLYGPAGELAGLHGIIWDVTRESELLRQEILLLETMLGTIPDSIYFKDTESRFTRANEYTAVRLGVRSPDDLIGKTDFDFFSNEHALRAFGDEQEIIRSGCALVGVEEKETLPDGRVRWVSTTKMPLRDPHGNVVGTFGISRDISERKLAEERLAHQAFYDLLTQLPNRALFMDRLEHQFRRKQRRGQTDYLFAIIFLDLDRFKGVNDSMGHQAGDELLVQLARRLETCLRPGDTLARLGGDEFTILLEDIRGEADATRVAERIHKELLQPFVLHDTEFFFTASVGIALSSTGYERPEEMLRDADTAMYRAKSNGRSRHEIFDADMHQRAVSQLQLETDLRRALERDECRVYYQPIVDLETGTLAGFEALMRWQHPQRGLVMPDSFIPMAEETGLIAPLGAWVLRESCRQMRDWQQRLGLDPCAQVAVNMSTRQLSQPDLVESVERVLEETGLPPGCLALEITESALMHNMSVGIEIMKRLHALGVHLNIDDFGTGYSSLSYLQSFPVESLKIDRSFIRQMNDVPGQAEIVRAIIALAQNLGMTVTAEGVETAEQIAALRALKCKRAQGYFFSRAVPAADVEALLISGLPKF